MLINEKSWHYQLSRFPDRHRAYNLCEYIRYMIYGLVWAITFAMLGATACLVLLVQPILNLLFSTWSGDGWAPLGAAGAILDAIFITVSLGHYLHHRTKIWLRNKTQPYGYAPNGRSSTSFVSIALRWLQDKHSKVCTMIQYK